MTLEVAGDPHPMDLPTTLPGTPSLPPIGPCDLTPTGPNGNGKRTLRFVSDQAAMTGEFTAAYRIIGDGETPANNPNDPKDPAYGRFDPDFVNQTLEIGAVEEWVLRNELEADQMEHPSICTPTIFW